MKTPFEGGCTCGAIRYRCDAEPMMMFNCHCRDCQRATGTGFAPVVYVEKARFSLTQGELAHYRTPAERGGFNLRGYCKDCGSRLTGGESERGIGINAASIDDPSGYHPQFSIFAADAQPWSPVDASVPAHPKYPPFFGVEKKGRP